MKKIARIVDSQTVEILTFEDDAQNLSAEFAVECEERKFDYVLVTRAGFIKIDHKGYVGVMNSSGEMVIPIKFNFIRVTSHVIVAQEGGIVTFYRQNGEVWEFEHPYCLKGMDYASECAVLAQRRNSKVRAIYSFAKGEFLIGWTKRSRLVGRHWFFEDKSGEQKFVCAENELSKLWPAEEIYHFSYATMVKIDGKYKIYLPSGLIENLGEKL